MIRTVLKPNKRSISIDLPEDFIGRQVEVLVFTIDEPVDQLQISDKPLTHIASEKVLGKEWLTAEEDHAWQDL